MRKLLTAWVTLILVFSGFAAGGANDRDETIMTVQVSSADHEIQEGYFTLGDHTLTFAANLERAAAVAAALRDEHGVQKGDRVAIFSANCPDYAVLFWAAVSLGAIVTAYNGWWTVDEVRYATELTPAS